MTTTALKHLLTYFDIAAHFCPANRETAFCNSSQKVRGSSVSESLGYSLAKNKSVGYIQVQGRLFLLWSSLLKHSWTGNTYAPLDETDHLNLKS